MNSNCQMLCYSFLCYLCCCCWPGGVDAVLAGSVRRWQRLSKLYKAGTAPEHTVGGHSEPWAQCSKCSQGRSTSSSNIAANFSLSLAVYLFGIALSLALLPVLINLNGRPQLKHAQRVRRSSYGKVRGEVE